ncbi:MAG: hypothetical protein GF353_03285 [Candidatus Lokiarchaeota archaeon]|nr:hypothetical protein [Candidatus Lokiarchaeota archaeon]
MYASAIGKIFLDEYNRYNQTNYSAKDYFTDEFLKLFFDHEKYMMKGGNSPLDNPKIKRGTFPDQAERSERIGKTIDLIESKPESSSAIGYPSADLTATTSGQVSSLKLPITPENVYLSWIGGGLGVGVNGGLAFYIQDAQILMDIFSGWQFYRRWLNETSVLKGNQIETWNGQWLAHYYDPDIFDYSSGPSTGESLKGDKNRLELKTQQWVKILLRASQKYPNKTILTYVFSLGQTNKTLGFLPVYLPEILRPIELYKKYFGKNQFLKDTKEIENIFGNNYGLYKACETGSIGIKALEPKALRDYMPRGKNIIPIYPDKQKEKITFRTYLVWVSAMLNNEKLINQAEKAAQIFLNYNLETLRGKTKEKRFIDELLKSPNPRKFIDGLTEIINQSSAEVADDLNSLVIELNKMPRENFAYFTTLIRFKYAYLNRKEQS